MDTSEKADIEALERQWMQAWVDKDLATCASILADDFILTSARGTAPGRFPAESLPRDTAQPAKRARPWRC